VKHRSFPQQHDVGADITVHGGSWLDLDTPGGVHVPVDSAGYYDVHRLDVADDPAARSNDEHPRAVQPAFDPAVHANGAVRVDLTPNREAIAYYRQSWRTSRSTRTKKLHCQLSSE